MRKFREFLSYFELKVTTSSCIPHLAIAGGSDKMNTFIVYYLSDQNIAQVSECNKSMKVVSYIAVSSKQKCRRST